jgi:hypothetical protein
VTIISLPLPKHRRNTMHPFSPDQTSPSLQAIDNSQLHSVRSDLHFPAGGLVTGLGWVSNPDFFSPGLTQACRSRFSPPATRPLGSTDEPRGSSVYWNSRIGRSERLSFRLAAGPIMSPIDPCLSNNHRFQLLPQIMRIGGKYRTNTCPVALR